MRQRFAGTPMPTFSTLLPAAAGGIGQTPAIRGASAMSKEDGVKTWETNWIMDFTREGGRP